MKLRKLWQNKFRDKTATKRHKLHKFCIYGNVFYTCHMWRISDFTTSAMWRQIWGLGVWVKYVTYLHLPFQDISGKDSIYFFVVINNCTSKYSPIYRYEKRHYIFSFLSFCIFTLSKRIFAKMWPICGFRIERSATVVVVSLLTSTKVPCHSCWSNLYEFLCLICLAIWQYDRLLSDDNFLIDSHIYFKQLQF